MRDIAGHLKDSTNAAFASHFGAGRVDLGSRSPRARSWTGCGAATGPGRSWSAPGIWQAASSPTGTTSRPSSFSTRRSARKAAWLAAAVHHFGTRDSRMPARSFFAVSDDARGAIIGACSSTFGSRSMGSPLPRDQRTDDVVARRGRRAWPTASRRRRTLTSVPGSRPWRTSRPAPPGAPRRTSGRWSRQRRTTGTSSNGPAATRRHTRGHNNDWPRPPTREIDLTTNPVEGMPQSLIHMDGDDFFHGTIVQSSPAESGRRLHMEMNTTTPSSHFLLGNPDFPDKRRSPHRTRRQACNSFICMGL